MSNWDALVRYCQDGDLEIDNNASQHSLRDVLGRVAQHSLTKLDELLSANWTPAIA